MITLLNAKERTFEEFAELFRKADPRFRMKQWGEAGGPPSSGKFDYASCNYLHCCGLDVY